MLFRIKVLLIFLILFSSSYAFSLNEFTAKIDVDRANRLLKNGDYDNAISLYEKALSKLPKSPEIYYNMGTTLSSMGDMESAVQAFDMAKKNFTEKTSKDIKNSTYYNAGISKIEMEDYAGAIEELIESLVNNPNDNNAKSALEYAKKKLEEQKKNSGESAQNNNNDNQDNANSNQNSQDNQNNNNNNNNQENQDNQNNNENNQNNQNNDNQENNNQNNNDNQENNNQDNNQNNQDNNNGNDNQNDEEQNAQTDIDRLLDSLRQYRKDKENDDQYYGGGRIDKDW
ncbi:tetratricopeptide repeat protein [Brachyspira pilosicoli]|uniref:tetratricopeptide repeat protein n=1 Tax=Brachyspira pilosicoli TaxID=52584 RepID=UPI001C6749C7|nr:tetratricopeptide repeat protein [Brachyspira pilosicoli]MBW5397163.1 tetratricopeptide repeat protein [Brachyspira pilosicoli]